MMKLCTVDTFSTQMVRQNLISKVKLALDLQLYSGFFSIPCSLIAVPMRWVYLLHSLPILRSFAALMCRMFCHFEWPFSRIWTVCRAGRFRETRAERDSRIDQMKNFGKIHWAKHVVLISGILFYRNCVFLFLRKKVILSLKLNCQNYYSFVRWFTTK